MSFLISTRFPLVVLGRALTPALSFPTRTSSVPFSSNASTQNVYGNLQTGETDIPIAAAANQSPLHEMDQGIGEIPRLPRSVQTIYLRPLRREAQYGVPSCDLQMRSYSVRNLEFFADFALRAAYYLKLPAFGPVPLPRIRERWTVPKSNFIFKKTQENFDRTTMRRLIQIRDGHPESVELWLAFLRKHSYYGIGMKATVWEFNELGISRSIGANLVKSTSAVDLFGRKKTGKTSEKVIELMNEAKFRLAASGNAPMMRP